MKHNLFRENDLINELTQVARGIKVHEKVESLDRYIQEGATHYAKMILKKYFGIDWKGENQQ